MAQPYTAYQPSSHQALGYQLDASSIRPRLSAAWDREYYEKWLRFQWELDKLQAKKAETGTVDTFMSQQLQEAVNVAAALLQSRQDASLTQLLKLTAKRAPLIHVK